MSERWVKATTLKGDEQWVNMAQCIVLGPAADKGSWLTLLGAQEDAWFREPPEHFLKEIDMQIARNKRERS